MKTFLKSPILLVRLPTISMNEHCFIRLKHQYKQRRSSERYAHEPFRETRFSYKVCITQFNHQIQCKSTGKLPYYQILEFPGSLVSPHPFSLSFSYRSGKKRIKFNKNLKTIIMAPDSDGVFDSKNFLCKTTEQRKQELVPFLTCALSTVAAPSEIGERDRFPGCRRLQHLFWEA